MIKAKGLSYTYPDGTFALSDINFESDSSRIGLIGPNGAGKTSLALLLLCLLHPFRGRLNILGLEVNMMNRKKLWKRVGLLFQHAENQFFMPTVLEDVALGLIQNGAERKTALNEALDILKSLSIDSVRDKSTNHLSIGEKRLVALAGLLASGREFFILDEPTSTLDMRGKVRIRDQIGNLKQGFILISHDMRLVKDLCDEVLLFDEGRLIRQGRTEEIVGDNELLKRHGLV